MAVLSPEQSALFRMRVKRILGDTRAKFKDKPLSVWNYILANEIASGSSFMASADGNLYIFLALLRRVYTMPGKGGGDHIVAYLESSYGVSSANELGREIYIHMRNYVVANAPIVELRRFVAYNKVDHICYVSNYRGQMWRLTGGTPELVNNGEDGIFFIDDDGGQPYDPDFTATDKLLDTLLTINYGVGGGGMTPDQMRKVMTIWLFMLAFPDRMTTKPILIIEGPAGAGKTSVLSMIQTALFGVAKPLIIYREKPDDFSVTLLRSPIALFDNVDNYIDWLPDQICSYATLGFWAKRKLYSNSDEVQLRPHAFMAVSTRNPASFRREDTADRCLVLHLARRTGFGRMEAVQAAVLAARNELLGEWMMGVNTLIKMIRDNVANGVPERDETTRMADFASFARVVSAYMGWDVAEPGSGKRDEVDQLMLALTAERHAFVHEEDPLVDLLKGWLKVKNHNYSNPGRLVPLAALYADLDGAALKQKLVFYKSAKILATNLRSPHLEKDFKIEMTVEDGHKSYRIWGVGNPQLRLVNGPDDDDGDVLE